MFARPREPSRDHRLPMAKHTHRCSTVQSFGQSGQNFRNAPERGFEAVHRGITPGAEGVHSSSTAVYPSVISLDVQDQRFREPEARTSTAGDKRRTTAPALFRNEGQVDVY
jgi:hypothetical protein